VVSLALLEESLSLVLPMRLSDEASAESTVASGAGGGIAAQKTGLALPPRKTWSSVRQNKMPKAGLMASALAVEELVAV
jgi:hypothetical protein